MTFRDSIHNLIRTDRPDSPTDAVFIFGMLVLLALQIYATLAKTTVPHFGDMLLAMTGMKTIKAARDVKNGQNQSNTQQPQ